MQLPAPMVTLGWLVGAVLIVDVWRSVSSTCGGLSAVITGHTKMLEWYANSLDTQEVVSALVYNSIFSHNSMLVAKNIDIYIH